MQHLHYISMAKVKNKAVAWLLKYQYEFNTCYVFNIFTLIYYLEGMSFSIVVIFIELPLPFALFKYVRVL